MRRRHVLASLFSLAVPRLAFASFLEWTADPPAGRVPAPPRPPRPSVPSPLRTPRIVVRKADRTLTLLDGEREVFRIHVGLGRRHPSGPKRTQGDFRTPEGRYFLCTRNDSKYRRFLGISYPNADDARAAADAGEIDRDTLLRIEAAEREGVTPPWDTAMGGVVGIHGGGGNRDWTAGCVAVDDPDVEELWRLCPVGTPIEILA